MLINDVIIFDMKCHDIMYLLSIAIKLTTWEKMQLSGALVAASEI